MPAASRGMRRFLVGYVIFLVVYAAVAIPFPGLPWMTRVVPILLLVGQIPLTLLHLAALEIDEDGLRLDTRLRSRVVPWSEIAAVEFGGPYGRAPALTLTDGAEVKSTALGGLKGGSERDPDVVRRLEAKGEEFGFELRNR